MLHLHVLASPPFVLVFGVILNSHIMKKLRAARMPNRRTGLASFGMFAAMVVSGYLLQVATAEAWLRGLVIVHVASGAVFTLDLWHSPGHQLQAGATACERPRSRKWRETLDRGRRAPSLPSVAGRRRRSQLRSNCPTPTAAANWSPATRYLMGTRVHLATYAARARGCRLARCRAAHPGGDRSRAEHLAPGQRDLGLEPPPVGRSVAGLAIHVPRAARACLPGRSRPQGRSIRASAG